MNILDYIAWRGDLKIDKVHPLTPLDHLILARIAYLRFDLVGLQPKETIGAAAARVAELPVKTCYWRTDQQLAQALPSAPRFKDLVITDHVKTISRSAEQQFEAITIHLPNRQLYVAFMGTDDTIVGWKEDFNLSFRAHVPAQEAGMEYVQHIARRYPRHKIILGGHSKGGHIALYVALTSSLRLQHRLAQVNNYDGPGLDSQLMRLHANQRILQKITTYIPQESIIGRFLTHGEPQKIVKSSAKGLYQHDIYSWQVVGTDFIYADDFTPHSEAVKEAVTDWLRRFTPEERGKFIDGVYEIATTTGSQTFSEFRQHIVKKLPQMYKTYRQLPKEDQAAITGLLVDFIKTYRIVTSKTHKNN